MCVGRNDDDSKYDYSMGLTEPQSGEDGGTPESSPLMELRGDTEGGVMGGLWL